MRGCGGGRGGHRRGRAGASSHRAGPVAPPPRRGLRRTRGGSVTTQTCGGADPLLDAWGRAPGRVEPQQPRTQAATPDGLRIRELTGTLADRDLLDRLILTCGPAALRARFFLPQEPDPPARAAAVTYRRYLDDTGPDATDTDRGLRATPRRTAFNLVPTGPFAGRGGRAFVAVDQQRRGVGTALLASAVAGGRWAGWTVRATVQHTIQAARGLLLRGGTLGTRPGLHRAGLHGPRHRHPRPARPAQTQRPDRPVGRDHRGNQGDDPAARPRARVTPPARAP